MSWAADGQDGNDCKEVGWKGWGITGEKFLERGRGEDGQ